MDELDDLPAFDWHRRIPKPVLLALGTIGLALAGLAMWQVRNGHDLPLIVVLFFAPFVALGTGLEIVCGIRALRAPTRRRFTLTSRSIGLLILAGGLPVVGVANLVDNDPENTPRLVWCPSCWASRS